MLAAVRDVLAGDGEHARRTPLGLLAIVVAAGALHGAAMGSLGFRVEAIAYGAIKLPILLLGATALCLPNLWVVHALLGLRAEHARVVRAIVRAQCVLAIAALAQSPFVVFAYVAGAAYPFALATNAAVLAIAAWCAQRALRRDLAGVIERAPRVRFALAAWFAIHAFVSTKLGWILRPFVGDPALATEFLRPERWADDPFTNLVWTVVGLVASLVRRAA